jgi:hypothetical protein
LRSGRLLREYTDNCVRLALEQNGLSQDVSIGCKGSSPQVVAEDDGLWPVGLVLCRSEVASDDGMDGEHIEVVLRDSSRVEILDVRSVLEIDAGGYFGGGGRDQGWDVIAEEFPLLSINMMPLVGGPGAGDPGVDGAHALGVRVRETLEHERVHDGEDRCVRTDGERQGKDDCSGKAGTAP